MKKNSGTLYKILAVIGIILVWLPIVSPILFSLIAFLFTRRFRFDFLMPAELFPMAISGSLMLLWVSFKTGYYKKPILWGIILAVGFLVGRQTIAVISGLASGLIEPKGWIFSLVIASLILYCLSIIEIGIIGFLLRKRL